MICIYTQPSLVLKVQLYNRFCEGNDVARLGDTLGRATILVCTECGVAIHVLDGEAHSQSCKATPRFPLPSQVGYHSDGQQLPSQQLAITYPSPGAGEGEKSLFGTAKKRKYRSPRVKIEPPELLVPKIEKEELPDQSSPMDEYQQHSLLKSPPSGELNDSTDDGKPIKKKAKVMLPSLGSPRGLRTLLPGLQDFLNQYFYDLIYHALRTSISFTKASWLHLRFSSFYVGT